MSNNAAGIGITNPNEFARRAAASEPNFNPYDALGIPVRAYTTAEIGAAFRQAQRHLHRATAPPAFPSMAEVNTARDYVHDVASRTIPRQTQAFARWARLPRTFFGELDVGAPGVFRPRPPPAPAPSPRAAPSPRGGGPSRPRPRREPGDPFYTPPRRPERPPPRRRSRPRGSESPEMRPPPRRSNSPARSPPRTRSRAGDNTTPNTNPQGDRRTGDRSGDASGYTRRERTPPMGSGRREGDSSGYTRRERTPPLGATAQNPHAIPSDDDDDAPPPTPTPSTRGAPLPRRPQQPPPHRSGGIFSGPPPPPPTFGAPPPTPSGSGPSPPLRENRSTGGTRARAAPVANPILRDEIIVGTWAHATTGGAGANAVVGVFDRRGHLNFRIVSRTMAGAPTPAPTGTSVSLHNISLRPPYASLDLAQLRTMIDQHIRLPRDQRP